MSQKARDPVELLPVLPAKLGPSRNVAVLVVIGHVIYGLDRSFYSFYRPPRPPALTQHLHLNRYASLYGKE